MSATIGPSTEELVLRQLLWLRHGCSGRVLYGDDGEMQCNRCLVDFRRMPAHEIDEHFLAFAAQTRGDRIIRESILDT